MNISSIIIRIHPEKWDQAIQAISKIPNVEISIQDEQKSVLIAIIQANSTDLELSALNEISRTIGVISANMHLSYNEESFRNCALESGKIAELIDTTPIENIRYNGDVNNFLKSKKNR